MLASILHRVAGSALAIAGLALLAWWLLAIAGGPQSYATFSTAAGHPLGLAVLIGLSWAFFQHLLSGIRHLTMDSGAGFELDSNKRFAVLTILGAVLLTGLLWFYILGARS